MDLPEPVTRSAALQAGFTDRELRGPNWLRIGRGQYVWCRNLDVTQRHLVLAKAVMADARPDAVLSHASAVVAHGLPVWDLPLDRVHVTRNRSNGARQSAQTVVHSTPFPDDDVTLVHGLRVLSVARTVVDLGRAVGFEQAVVVGDAALRLGLTTTAELRAMWLANRRRPGSPNAGRVVGFVDGRAASPGESRSRVGMHVAGLPAPELQATVLDENSAFVARVDFLFPGFGVIGEFDGRVKYGKHLRGEASVEQVMFEEKRREDALRALGWIVVRWTWADLQSGRWIERILAAARIGRRSARLGSWAPAR